MNAIIHANEKDNIVTWFRHLKKGEQVSIVGKTSQLRKTYRYFTRWLYQM